MILRSRKESWGCVHGGSQGDSTWFVKVHIVFCTPCMAQQLGCVLVATAAVGFGGIGMVDQKRTLQMRVGLFLLFDDPHPFRSVPIRKKYECPDSKFSYFETKFNVSSTCTWSMVSIVVVVVVVVSKANDLLSEAMEVAME